MINIKYITDAHRLRAKALDNAQAYGRWQYALHYAKEELKERQEERNRPTPPERLAA